MELLGTNVTPGVELFEIVHAGKDLEELGFAKSFTPNSRSHFLSAASKDGRSTHRVEYFYDPCVVWPSQVQNRAAEVGDLD
jgi:hypothetical protein